MVLSRLCGVRRPLADNQEAAMQTTGHSIRGVQDVISYIDARQGISGRAGTIWWLALGGLFLDAFSNSALSVELEKASRKRPPSASHQMVPARPEMPWRASMYEMTS